MLTAAGLAAQSPSGFRFQAVARDVDNNAMSSENIAVRVSLLQGGPTGAVAYSERHEVSTTDLGVFDLHIGNGSGLSGDINTIDWGSDTHFLKIDVDPDGGTNYVNLGSSQLLSVPYALYAKESGSGGGGDPTDELQNLIYDPVTQTLTLTNGNSVTLQVGGGGGGGTDDQTISLSGTLLSIERGNAVDLAVLQDGTEDADADPTNEIQNLSFNVATNELSIAGGNTITIPAGGTDADADPTNEIQTITLSGDQLTLSDGGGSVTLPSGGGGTDNQVLAFNPATNELSISGGNTVTIPTGGTDADADPTNEIQTISVSGNTITLSDGGGSGSIDVNDADADPANELQTITKAGSTVTLSDGGGTFTDETEDADADPANEIQTLSLAGNDLSLSNGGGSVTLPSGGNTELELPYYEEVTSPATTAAFHVHNNTTNATYGVVGTTGTDGATIPANRAGVHGYSTDAHGVYGRSENSFYAGVQGVSNSANGYGVLGYGFGGGIGGYFYTTSTGEAALTTGVGNVGIGTQAPEEKMHVAGDLFVQTNLGNLQLGFPGTGNRWSISTIGSGADLQFRSKPSGSNTFSTRFRFQQEGEFQVGNISGVSAWSHVRANSTLSKPQLKLEEVGNDYARLELTNDAAGGAFWHVAGLPSTTTANARLNFYFRNANGAADRMTITGDGEVGINGVPTARLHVHQRSQTVGTGLRFSDNTANEDWDITHGFALRFHYGGSLRGFINANTGAYTQSSDKSLKTAVASMTPVLDKVLQLGVKTYQYKSAEQPETTIGLLAQDAAPLFPTLVSYSKVDSLYGVNYAGFSMVAIKAIQEQQAQITEQADQIEALKNRLARLEQLLLGKE